MEPDQTSNKDSKGRGTWMLWTGVIIMFLLIISAWVTVINIARDNPVQEVEMEPDRSVRPD